MLTIEIFDSGVAFEDRNVEIARLLHALADRFTSGNPPEVLRDINGNTCGEVKLDPMTEYTEE